MPKISAPIAAPITEPYPPVSRQPPDHRGDDVESAPRRSLVGLHRGLLTA
jgi:hypothetical protein